MSSIIDEHIATHRTEPDRYSGPTPNVMDDLFAEAPGAALDPRYVREVDDEQEGPPMLASVERMCEVFREQVGRVMPSPAEIHRMQTTGFHLTEKNEKRPGHRYVIERGSMPIEGFLGKVPEPLWAITVHRIMDRGTLGTFRHALAYEQSNGDWVPVQVDARQAPKERRIITRNGQRAARTPLPENDSEKVAWMGSERTEPVNVAVETFEYAIVWMDRNNAPAMPKLDANGKPIGTEVNVRVEASPADPSIANALVQQGQALHDLAQGIKTLAERPAGPPPLPGNVPFTPKPK